MADRPLGDVRRALVMGVGATGRVVVPALRSAGVVPVVVDDRTDADVQGLDAEVHLGGDAIALLDDVQLVVPSPGVPEHHPTLVEAVERGLPVWSEPELGWRLHPRTVVAITGTNGKTSVTELVTEMLVASGRDAVACGNIGRAFTDAAGSSDPGTVLVAELSSFQLRFCHALRPHVGVLLNLAPDHLDWHGDLTSYGAAKARIWRAQGDDDWAVVNATDTMTTDLAARFAPANVAQFDGNGVAGLRGVVLSGASLVSRVPGAEGTVVALSDLEPAAPHHHANVAAAATAALLAGADREAVGRAATTFRPGRHRMERVATIAGVEYVDDSKATNAHAAAAALASADDIVWIAGGIAKGVDLGVLAPSLGTVRHAVLIGQAADALADLCTVAGVSHERADSMDAAVAAAHRVAQPGSTVLLAPACSSFDMFRDYADRGDRFVAAVTALRGQEVEA